MRIKPGVENRHGTLFRPRSPRCFAVRLTLLVPELLWPEPADQFTLGKLATPGFDWLAARARFSRQPRLDFESALAQQFGLQDAPFGALRRLGESNADAEAARNGHWLCADPVHLRFHHERIILADAGAFDLDLSEAAELVAALNAEFAEIGRFYPATARRWYLQLTAAVDHRSQPISRIAGRRMDGELKEKNSPLTRWLNEVQMFLHNHPINARRQAAGLPAVNSLWLWGNGSLPEITTCPFATIHSDNPLAIGLARAAQQATPPLPASLDEWLGQNPAEAHHLIVLDSLLPPVLYEDGEGWRQACEKLDRQWFTPLRTALGRKIDAVDIVAPTIYGQLTWSLQGKDRWKFWRQGKPLAALAHDLAEGTQP